MNADHTHISTYAPFDRTFRARPNMLYGKPLFIDPNCPPGKLYWLSDGCYAHPGVVDDLIAGKYAAYADQIPPPATTNTKKEPDVSTIDKIKQERREKREREELEAKFQEWDEIFASERADVGFFTRDIGEKTYRYAAINADERWYLTGMETRAFTVEDFIAWLIEHDVQTEKFVWLETIE